MHALNFGKRKCGGGAGGVSALLGLNLTWHVPPCFPLYRPGAGGLIRRPACLTRAKREAAGVVLSGGGWMLAPRLCPLCLPPG